MQRRKNESGWTSAKVLSEALPFIQRHSGRWIVIKFGGHAMGSPKLTAEFAKDIVLLQQCGLRPVVVHGGGPQIGTMLGRLQIKTEFKDGLRVSDMETVGVAEMVLSGAINKSIVSAINVAGGKAVGISGRDARLITARPVNADLGFTGEPTKTDVSLIETLARAGVIASALSASRLMLLTDIAVENNVEAVVILDGRRAHGLLVELFTDMGAGTLIR